MKYLIIAVVIIFFAVGCKQKEPITEKPPTSENPQDLEKLLEGSWLIDSITIEGEGEQTLAECSKDDLWVYVVDHTGRIEHNQLCTTDTSETTMFSWTITNERELVRMYIPSDRDTLDILKLDANALIVTDSLPVQFGPREVVVVQHFSRST